MSKLSEFLQDEDGRLSMTRLLMILLVLAYICWTSIIVWRTGTITDVPLQLAGLLTLLYGINKVGPNINIGGKP